MLRVCLQHNVKFGSSIGAQSVRAPNSNRKVARSMPTLGIMACCVHEMIRRAIIPTSVSGKESRLATTRLSNFDSVPELDNASLSPWKKHSTPILP